MCAFYLQTWSEPAIVLFELCYAEQWEITSNGRAHALHAGGAGIDARILHFVFLYFFVCTVLILVDNILFVPNESNN